MSSRILVEHPDVGLGRAVLDDTCGNLINLHQD